MANIKITELDAATTLASTDVLVAVDVSEDVTKKTTVTDLFRTLPDGTAAAPALAFADDNNTGILSPAENQLAFATGGTQRVTIDGSGNVTISGDLTVSGATTTVESTTVTIDDKNIELGSVASPSNTTADGGGITLKGATDKTIKWINSTGYWTFNTGIEVGGHLQIDDSNEIRVGTGSDLKIFHDATDSFVSHSGPGHLYIRTTTNDKDVLLQTDNGSGGLSNYVVCDGSSGEVKLYHYGTQKLNTSATGISVTGQVNASTMHLTDGNGIHIGNSNDLQIYHDGSNSYVKDAGTGNLILAGTRVNLLNAAANETLISAQSDGPVELYYDNAKKFETKSDGIDVTGEVQCDSLDVDGAADISGSTLQIGSTSSANTSATVRSSTSGDGGYYFNDGSNSGAIIYNHTNNYMKFRVNGSDKAQFDSSGRLLVGLSTARQTGSGFTAFHQVEGGDTVSSASLTITSNRSTDDLGARLNFARSKGSSVGSNTVVDDNAELGGIYFWGADGTDTNSQGAEIIAEVDGTPGSNDMPTRLVFGTTADGASSPTERFRIDSSGAIKVQTNNVNLQGAGTLRVNSGSTSGSLNLDGGATNHGGEINLNGGSNGGNIQFRAGEGSGQQSEVARIDSSGRLMLGTSTEGNANADNFTIADSANSGLTIRSGSSNIGSIFFSDATSGTGEYAGFVDYNHSSNKLSLGTASTTRVYIDSSGNFGVGAASPNSPGSYAKTLEVSDANSASIVVSRTDSTAHSLELGAFSGASLIESTGATSLRFKTNSSEAFRIDSAGRMLIGTTTEGVGDADEFTVATSGNTGITIRSGTSGTGNLYFSDGTSGVAEYRGSITYDHGNDVLNIGTFGTPRLSINSNGAWGIEGTSNYGTSGQVLTSNGNDSPTWQDAGAVNVGGASAISMNDSVNINFGNGNDLQIFHNGSNSEVVNNTGDLFVKNNTNDADIVLETDNSSGGTTPYVRCDGSTGDVILYQYGSQKLQTFSSGVDITGELQCDSLDVDGGADITGNVTLHANLDLQDNDRLNIGSSDDISMFHNGADSFIDNSTGDLYIRGIGDDLFLRATDDIYIQPQGNDNGISVLGNGAVELYYNSSRKLQTKSDGIDVTGEVQCDSLDVDGSSNFAGDCSFLGGAAAVQIEANSDIRLINGTWTGDYGAKLQHHGNALYIQGGSNGIIFRDPAGSDRAQINSGGHLHPAANNTYDLGTSTYRWRNLYTNDLNLSNEGSGNDVDGTWGNYTIQEGEDDLFLINRRNGKKYKFNLTEVS